MIQFDEIKSCDIVPLSFRLTDYEVFGMNVLLPISGRIITAIDKVFIQMKFLISLFNKLFTMLYQEVDNVPQLDAAIELMDHESGENKL